MDRAQEVNFNAMGYSIEELKNLKRVERMDFVNKEGELLPNLPADPYHLARWKLRGFKVAPPREPEPLKCESCGKGPFKAKIGLMGHMRTHTQI